MATPPTDPPAASATLRRGQEETNSLHAKPGSSERSLTDIPNAPSKESPLRPAFEFGWQSYLQHGRAPATEPVTFESIEQELAHKWELASKVKNQELPWEAAREAARNAWNLVEDAMTGGSSSPSP